MDRPTKRNCTKMKTGLCALALAAALVAAAAGVAVASTLVTQTALPGDCIPQFAVPLPVFGPAGPIPRVDAVAHPKLTVTMREVNQQVLPAGPFACAPLGAGVTVTPGKTRVWAYETRDTATRQLLGPAHWPAVTIEAKRGFTVDVKYVNKLPQFNAANPTGLGLVQGLLSVDQTIDWTDPLGTAAANGCTAFPQILPLAAACMTPYVGPAPATAHLHGGEVASAFDGGPLSWYTKGGIKGRDYRTLYNAGPGTAVYRYPNKQEPGTLWFHDHTMGQTRTNVYSGLEGFYLLRQPRSEPANLPRGAFEVELAIQDRQFDTTGQLFFPDGSGADVATANLNGPPGNPANHPFWIPEFAGDVVVVNGAPWPFFAVQPRRYRFRILNGSNARPWNLSFGAAPVYAIGADDNYLDAPAPVTTVFLMPGERADVIVDFAAAAGTNVTVTNDAPVPFPAGLVPGVAQPGMANVMQFQVAAGPVADTSCNPATAGQCTRRAPMVRLTDGAGNLAAGVVVDRKRRLVLKEIMGAGGPLMVTLNNTLFDGTMSPGLQPAFPDGVTERPRQGSTELWEIVNLTADAHPIHTHLTQFQILNRQAFDTTLTGYPAAWEAAFPAYPAWGCTAGVLCPGYGPPLPYGTPVGGFFGGNPDLAPFLVGAARAPAPAEAGWKETAAMLPGEVTRILVRYAPTETPVTPGVSLKGRNLFSFDPTAAPPYFWHCHIIDHEDQDMMRPYVVRR